MTRAAASVAVGTLLTAALLTGLFRYLALTHGLIDVPNQRSSHRTPTPRGGGLAIVLATSLALVTLAALGALSAPLLWALLGGGALVAVIGLLDDRRPVPAGVRFAVHVTAVVWALYWLGGLTTMRIGAHDVVLGGWGYLCAGVGILWVLNLFNFMDGIDGLAASEAALVALCGAWLTAAGTGIGAAALVLAAASGGFLAWNWPPARIFMGDVGSGYLGYVIAVLTLAAARTEPVAVWVWLILGGVFFVDATVTLVRRGLRGERVYQAHRSHAYQWLARRWGSHGRVTGAVLLVNLLWLLPWAVAARRQPQLAVTAVLLALAPLALLALLLGAGRLERNGDSR